MAWTASDFDATKPEVKVMAEKVFGDSFDMEKFRETAILKAIAENQAVSMSENFDSNGRCTSVDVYGLTNDDNISVADGTDDNCEITGGRASVEKESYTNNLSKKVSFYIPDDDCPNMVKATQEYAFNYKNAMIRMHKELAELIAPKLLLNADTNVRPTDVGGQVEGAVVEILQAGWDTDLIGQMYYNAQMHDLGNDLMFISGSNFFQSDLLKTFQSNGCCNVDGILDSSLFKYVFDIKNTDTITGSNTSYIVRNGSVFLFSNNKWDNLVARDLEYDNTKAWKVKMEGFKYRSGNMLKDVYLDVRSQRKCTNGVYGTAYEFIFRGGLHTGRPNEDGLLGILGYDRVDAYTT